MVVWSVPSLCCKSSPPCPAEFWKIPNEYRCFPRSRDQSNCANDRSCINYKYVCDGEQDVLHKSLRLRGPKPEEDICTDEFCATLPGGRTIRCPGTTRCIAPYTNYFNGTNIPIGPLCEEVDSTYTCLEVTLYFGWYINILYYICLY